MARKARTPAERRADAAEEAAIAHSRHYHANMSQLDRYVSEASRRDAAERRLEAQLRMGRPRRRKVSTSKRPWGLQRQRPAWCGRPR